MSDKIDQEKQNMDELLGELTKHSDKASLSRSLSGFSPDVIEAAREFDESSQRLQNFCNEFQRIAVDYQTKCRKLQDTILNTSPVSVRQNTKNTSKCERDTLLTELQKVKLENDLLTKRNSRLLLASCTMGLFLGTMIVRGVYSWFQQK